MGFRIKDLHHVSVIVADTPRALDFYNALLGLPVVPDRPDLPAVKAAVAEAVRVPQMAANGGEQMILF